MPLLNKLPNVGDRAIVLVGRRTGRNASHGWTAVSGSDGTINQELALAEVICNHKSHGNIRREDRHFDGITFIFYDPEFREADRKFIQNTVYYAYDYMSMGINVLDSCALPLQKEFLAGFLYPQPVVDGGYAKLVQDVRGDTNLPASASALIETIKQQATELGVRWLPLPEQPVYAELPQATRDRLEADYESYINTLRSVSGTATFTIPQTAAPNFTGEASWSDPPSTTDSDDSDDEYQEDDE